MYLFDQELIQNEKSLKFFWKINAYFHNKFNDKSKEFKGFVIIDSIHNFDVWGWI